MTFSIVARDSETGDLGVAVASKFLAAGAVVSHARAGVGAVATQAFANTSYGPNGLALLADGVAPADAIERLTSPDDSRSHRQLGLINASGTAATYTGADCIDWAGGRTGDGYAAQGNILAGAGVVDAIVDTFTAGGRPFPELLVDCLRAADEAGGDRRGRQSAGLLVVREGGGYGGLDDRWIDLRVDDDLDPMGKLGYLLELTRLYRDRPAPEDLIAIDESLARELRSRLESAGYAPANLSPGGLAAVVEAGGVVRTGEPRHVPPGWDAAWEGALAEWMSVENLEERMAARGWIDPRVLDYLRRHAAG